jgi:queuine/archaeosine tRNA-ribosyltransferase
MRIILGTPVKASPKPWLYFPVEAVMINALDEAAPKAREALGFEGELWADSGGYQILRKGIPVNLGALAERYKRIGADAYLALDVPPSPQDPPEAAERKAEASYRNWIALRRELAGARVLPVVHVYPRADLFRRWLKRYEGEEELAIGGAVPYVLTAKGVPRNSRRLALELIAEAARTARVHVLGMGSPAVSAALEALGVGSADSATWRLKAAYGKVLLPGGGERHVTDREVKFGRRKADAEELAQLREWLQETGVPLGGWVPGQA